MMEYCVDRITEGVAVLQTLDGSSACVPSDLLPDGAKEGSVLRQTDGGFVVDEAASEERSGALLALQEALLLKDEQGHKEPFGSA